MSASAVVYLSPEVSRELAAAYRQRLAPRYNPPPHAKTLRLEAAEALYGVSVSELRKAADARQTPPGPARLKVRKKKLPIDAKRGRVQRIILVEPAELERWIADNFDEGPEE